MKKVFFAVVLSIGLQPMVGYSRVFPQTGYDYYVNAAKGKDTNVGTNAVTAFKTLDKALSVVTNNQAIGILPGEYAFPAFYRDTDNGAPIRVDLVGIDGAEHTTISQDLTEKSSYCRLCGYKDFTTAETMSGFFGLTIKGCRPNGNRTKTSPFRWCYFQDCEFTGGVCTNGFGAYAFVECVLARTTISDYVFVGSGGNGSQMDAPVIVGYCSVWESSFNFRTLNSIALLQESDFIDTYVTADYINSVFSRWDSEDKNATNPQGCVIVVQNTGTNYISTDQHFYDCLVGIDKLIPYAQYSPTSVITNYSIVAEKTARGVKSGRAMRASAEVDNPRGSSSYTWRDYRASWFSKNRYLRDSTSILMRKKQKNTSGW